MHHHKLPHYARLPVCTSLFFFLITQKDYKEKSSTKIDQIISSEIFLSKLWRKITNLSTRIFSDIR